MKKYKVQAAVGQYLKKLQEQEKSKATLEKYARDIKRFLEYGTRGIVTKQMVMDYKKYLQVQGYEIASINSMLAAVNGFLAFLGLSACRVQLFKQQRRMFCGERETLCRSEYERLLQAAKHPRRERLGLIIQTICATGIRVSELAYITKEALQARQAVVNCKGKLRAIGIPKRLQKILLSYVRKQGIKSGPIFITRTGRPVNRSNIWREMKMLCQEAGVEEKKVFPHNLRHLFARTFYGMEKDIVALAAALGHSSIETTRIYTRISQREYFAQIDRLGLV